MAVAARFWIGTSGWHYAHWRGVFYPEDVPTSRWLAHYAAIEQHHTLQGVASARIDAAAFRLR